MAKRRAKSKIANLTLDQKKLGIDLIYLAIEGVRQTVRKLSTRAITLLWTAFRSEVCLQSYGAPKLRESQLARFRCNHLDVGSVANHRVNPLRGGRQ
jgi:hypothetical protein